MTLKSRNVPRGAQYGVPYWIGATVGGVSLLLVAGIAVALSFGNWVVAGAIGAIGYAPLLLALLLSLIVVARSIERRPIIPPTSLLAQWIRGLGRASVATFGLAIGALVGAVAGSSTTSSDPSRAFNTLMSFLVIVVTVGLLGAVLVWGALGSIDIARVPLRKREIAVYRVLRQKTRRARQLADAAASLGSPAAVLMVGLGLALLILTVCNIALSAL